MAINVELRDLFTAATIVFVILNYLHQRFAVIASLQERLHGLETQFQLVWDIVKGEVGFMVKAPTHFRMDTLIDKFVNQGQDGVEQFTLAEGYELQTRLDNRLSEPDLPREKYLAGALLKAALNVFIYQREQEHKLKPKRTLRDRVMHVLTGDGREQQLREAIESARAQAGRRLQQAGQ